MSEDVNSDATNGVERTEKKHRTRRTEAKYRPILRHHHERLSTQQTQLRK